MLVSPAKTKLGCCPVEGVELLAVDELLLADDDGRRSIQGTATCLPEALEEVPVEAELLELELPELLPELPDELSEITAKSIRPEAGLMIVSLMVPNVSPEEPVTLAPVSWLALMSWCPMRPVAPQ